MNYKTCIPRGNEPSRVTIQCFKEAQLYMNQIVELGKEFLGSLPSDTVDLFSS